jgi:hypothetical protein
MAVATEAGRRAPSTPAAPSVTPTVRPRGPRLDLLFTAVFALFGWAVGVERLSDNSFFWHLRTGELILDSGFPHGDPFSFSAPGTHWVVQSWLAELLYAVVVRVTSPFGIRVVVGLTGVAIAVLAFRLALRLTQNRVRAALLTALALASLDTLWSERPLIFGILALVVLVWVVEVPDSWVGRRPVLAIPVLVWCWANVHGTFVLGFAYLGLHLLGRWLDGHRPWEGRERRLLTGTAVAAVAVFLNPYGVSLVTFPTVLLSRADIFRHIVEWGSPDFHSLRGELYALWIVTFVVLLVRAPGKVSRRDLLVSLPFLVLGLWALRNIALAPLVGLPIAARAVAGPRRTQATDRSSVLGWGLAAALLLVVTVFTVNAAGQPNFDFAGYPVRAMQADARAGLLGKRLLTTDVDAGYVILQYWPRQRVLIDDRYDMYPRPIIADYFTLARSAPGWDAVLKREDIQVILWPRGDPLVTLVEDTGQWRVLYQDHARVLLVRDDVR